MQVMHVIILVCGALASACPGLEAAFPTGAVYIKVVATILTMIVTVLGPLSPQANAKQLVAKLAGTALCFVGLFSVLGLMGCANGQPTPQTVTDINAGVQLAVCVWNTASVDEQAGMTPVQIAVDCVARCGADAATVAVLLDVRAKTLATAKAKK